MGLKESKDAAFKSLTTRIKLIRLGFIRSPHGVKGEVLLNMDLPSLLEPFPQKLYGRKEAKKQASFVSHQYSKVFDLENIRMSSKGPIVLFKNYMNRSQVEKIKGWTVYFDAEPFQSSRPSESFYLFELLGFRVYLIKKDRSRKKLGSLSHFISYMQRDFFVVQSSKKCIEIPYISNYIQSMDFKKRTILLDLPEGFPGCDV